MCPLDQFGRPVGPYYVPVHGEDGGVKANAYRCSEGN